MKIAVVGTGYVGLVSGVCFAEMGNTVYCVDVNEEKIKTLKNGVSPIYEPGLDELMIRNINSGRLNFTMNLTEYLNEVDMVFCAVGTPPDEDGSADLKYVLQVATTVGQNIDPEHHVIFVTKSTVPVGTAQKVKDTIQKNLRERNIMNDNFSVASNPEFLKEGTAINDFMHPDRVVVGVENEISKELMQELYKPFMLNDDRLIFTTIPSSEMIKYASNSMLATRISFMNEIAQLCDAVGANVDDVRKGMGSDTRIGKKFLYPGCGYGGSCFPKDVKALIHTGNKEGVEMAVLKAVENVNEVQKKIVYKKLLKALNGAINGKKVAIWGLSFKPDTDDMREATSLVLMKQLLDAGAEVHVYDPIALKECKRRMGDAPIIYHHDKYEAIEGVDALCLITEWKEFRVIDWDTVKDSMNGNIIIDGRNLYNRKNLEKLGFIYEAIGK